MIDSQAVAEAIRAVEFTRMRGIDRGKEAKKGRGIAYPHARIDPDPGVLVLTAMRLLPHARSTSPFVACFISVRVYPGMRGSTTLFSGRGTPVSHFPHAGIDRISSGW